MLVSCSIVTFRIDKKIEFYAVIKYRYYFLTNLMNKIINSILVREMQVTFFTNYCTS